MAGRTPGDTKCLLAGHGSAIIRHFVTSSPRHTFCSRSPGLPAAVPAGRGQPPGFPPRVVVHHRLAGGCRETAWLPGDVFPRATGSEARQSERVCPPPDHDRACRALRPGAREAHPRAARGARRLRAGGRRTGARAGVGRRLAAGATGPLLPDAPVYAGLPARSRLAADPAAPAPGRERVEPQGPGA